MIYPEQNYLIVEFCASGDDYAPFATGTHDDYGRLNKFKVIRGAYPYKIIYCKGANYPVVCEENKQYLVVHTADIILYER